MLRSLAVAERLQNADCSCEVALHPHLAEQGALSDFSSHTNTQNATNTHKYTHTHTHIHKMHQTHRHTSRCYTNTFSRTRKNESSWTYSQQNTSHLVKISIEYKLMSDCPIVFGDVLNRCIIRKLGIRLKFWLGAFILWVARVRYCSKTFQRCLTGFLIMHGCCVLYCSPLFSCLVDC